jgi:hypothetical protein
MRMAHKLVPAPREAPSNKIQHQVLLVAFFDDEGRVHREFVPIETSVTADFYMDVLTRLRYSVRRKLPRKWKNDWALHHDNAPSHTAIAVQQFLA